MKPVLIQKLERGYSFEARHLFSPARDKFRQSWLQGFETSIRGIYHAKNDTEWAVVWTIREYCYEANA